MSTLARIFEEHISSEGEIWNLGDLVKDIDNWEKNNFKPDKRTLDDKLMNMSEELYRAVCLITKEVEVNEKEPDTIQGLTKEQWQFVIDSKFDVRNVISKSWINLTFNPFDLNSDGLFNIEIRREVGHRQPNFGLSTQPNGSCSVAVKTRLHGWLSDKAKDYNFSLDIDNYIEEFIILKEYNNDN